MIPSYVLTLREGLEAALIIGIVLGVLKKIQHTEFIGYIWYGAFSAAVISLVAALTLTAVGASFDGSAEEVFEGITMLLAAGVLTWMIFWMQRQAHNIKDELETDVRHAVSVNCRRALFALAFFAVLREGIELALFLIAATITSNTQQVFIGGLLGLGTAVILGYLIFTTTMRLNLQHFLILRVFFSSFLRLV